MSTAVKTKKIPPHVDGLPFLGLALDFKHEPLNFIGELWKKHGDIVTFKLPGHDIMFINRPEWIKHVLLKNQANYSRKNMMYREMQTLFGRATAVSDGERWKLGQKLLQPTFAFKNVENMIPVFVESITESMRMWEEKGKKGEYLNLSEDIHRMTLDIIIRTMFGGLIKGHEDQVTKSFRTILRTIVDRILSPVNLPLWMPTPKNSEYNKEIKALDEIIFRAIQERKSNPVKAGYNDMLSMWIEAMDKMPEGQLTEADLRDELIGIFVAAHGSTAVFLSWTFYHLASHQNVQEKVFQEVTSLLQGKKANVEDLDKLVYTNQVVQESMRITPPGWIISRSSIEEDYFDDYYVAPNTMVLISPYYLHHHPEFWKNPEQFNPERFSEENGDFVRQVNRDFSYIPFSGGPKVCTGKNMAMVECVMIVAMVIQKFKISLKPDHVITPTGGFTLTLGGGLLVKLEPR